MTRIILVIIALLIVVVLAMALASIVTSLTSILARIGNAVGKVALTLLLGVGALLLTTVLGGDETAAALVGVAAAISASIFLFRPIGTQRHLPTIDAEELNDVIRHPEPVAEIERAWENALRLAPAERKVLKRARDHCSDFLKLAQTFDIADADGRELNVRISRHIPETVKDTEAICQMQASDTSKEAVLHMVEILTGLGGDARRYLDQSQLDAFEALEIRAKHLDNQRRR